jgi:inorganic pyrophosphatase
MTTLPALRKDGSLNGVVESPRGSSVKFKYDLEDDVMTVSRPLPAGLTYPQDWGFVPSTRADDGDPLDAWILGRRELSRNRGRLPLDRHG